MKFLITILVFFSFANNCLANTKKSDEIIAVVNDDAIMQSDLDKARKEFNQNPELFPKGKTPKQRIVKKLIYQKLQDEYLRLYNSQVTSEVIDQGILQLASNNKMTVADFLQRLKAQNVSLESLRNKIKNDIELNRLVKFLVPDLKINEQEISQELKKLNYDTNLPETKYKVKHILVSNETLAKEILQKLKEGENFGKLAQDYSDSFSALMGGDLGELTQQELPQNLSSEIMKMKPNEVRGFYNQGFNIVLLTDLIINPESQQLRQKAVQIVTQKKLNRYLKRLFDKMQKSNFIEIY